MNVIIFTIINNSQFIVEKQIKRVIATHIMQFIGKS